MRAPMTSLPSRPPRRAPARLAAVVLALAAAGCSSTVDGAATPVDAGGSVPPGPVVYGVTIGDEARARFDRFADMRTWDPCALIDPTVLQGLGEVESQTSRTDFDTCYAYATPPGSGRLDEWRVRLELDPSFSDYRREDAPTQSIAGTQVLVLTSSSSPGECDLGVPVDDERVVDLSVDWSGSGPAPAPSCDAATALVEAMVPMLADPVRRAEGRYPVATPIATADPCAAIASYTAEGRAVQWDIDDGTLTRCTFSLGNGRDAADLDVDTGVAYTDSSPSDDEIPLTIGGFDATQRASTSGRSCTTTVRGRTEVPEGGRLESSTVVESITARADDCDQSNDLAERAVATIGLR